MLRKWVQNLFVRNFPRSLSTLSLKPVPGKYNTLDGRDIDHFKSILSEPSMVLTAENTDLNTYNKDWIGLYKGSSKLVLRPKTTEQASEVLRYCNERRLAVVPQGGNTGLVGGSVPVFDEVIISTQLMNNILSFDSTSGVLVCQSGCVLDSLNENLKEQGYMMPLDLGAKGSCHIGGNVSTNAGGIRLLRYGSLQGSVLGVEVVMSNGTVLDLLSGMRKDNVGYHLKHLFIGSEGTLGLVSKVAINCCKLPQSVNLAFFSCSSFESVLKIFEQAKSKLGEIISAYEMMDSVAVNCSVEYLKMKLPIEKSKFYVVIETSGSVVEHDQEKLHQLFESLSSEELIIDGTLALDLSKIKELWKLRESVPLGVLGRGHYHNYDVSLPLKDYYDIIEIIRKRFAHEADNICGFGHLGDGNLHLNFTTKSYDEDLVRRLEGVLYEYVLSKKGSISAEHGIGVFKKDYLPLVRSPQCLDVMKLIKQAMDPNNILNPYKILPE